MPDDIPCSDPVIERVVSRLRSRSQLGVSKYGTTLAGNPAGVAEIMLHRLEEILDDADYTEWYLGVIQECDLEGAAKGLGDAIDLIRQDSRFAHAAVPNIDRARVALWRLAGKPDPRGA